MKSIEHARQFLHERRSVLLPAVILPFGILLLQIHGIGFWNEQVGPLTGWLWATLLEAGALWLWSRKDAWRWLGLLATALLLIGPLLHVSKPLLDANEAHAAAASLAAQELQVVDAEIRSLEQDLETQRRNSETRAGWQTVMQETRAKLEAKRAEKRELLRTAAQPTAVPLEVWGLVALKAVALCFYQTVNVLAVLALSHHRKPAPAQVPIAARVPAAPRSTPPAPVPAPELLASAPATAASTPVEWTAPEAPAGVETEPGNTASSSAEASESSAPPLPHRTVAAPESPESLDERVRKVRRQVNQALRAGNLSTNGFLIKHGLQKAQWNELADHTAVSPISRATLAQFESIVTTTRRQEAQG